MSPILSLINGMRHRPIAIFVGTTSLKKLVAFLHGYDYALCRKGETKQADPFFLAFGDWIHQHFGDKTCSWEELILQHSDNDMDAVQRFWGSSRFLVGNFLAQKSPKVGKFQEMSSFLPGEKLPCFGDGKIQATP